MAEPIIKFDFSSFQKMADRLGVAQQQLPFALSRALNQSAFATRERLVSEWPQYVTERNKGFIKWALGVEPATKSELTVRITDSRANGRGFIKDHVDGGTKDATGTIAVPVAGQRMGARGVVPSQRPRNLKRAFKKGNAVYQVVGKGSKKRLKLVYVLKPSVPLPRQVPFRELFKEEMTIQMQQRAPQAMLDAMKTAIKR